MKSAPPGEDNNMPAKSLPSTPTVDQQRSFRCLWRIYTWSLGIEFVIVLGLAVALYGGIADPPRAGPLLWEDDFKHATGRWELHPPSKGWLAAYGGALVAEAGGGEEQCAWALTPAPASDFTLEVAGAQTHGESSAVYGLVFDWQTADRYQAVLVNGNGYAIAYRQNGATRQEWFSWQQWPHILVGSESNRVRVDVRGRQITARVNDEYLAATGRDMVGHRLGVMMCTTTPVQVVFSWVRLWALP